jgi:FtsH-binding integral membrane protein
MTEKRHMIPVWFFVGVLLLIYGVLILISGLVEWSQPTDLVLANLHAPVWWGALLTVLGIVYCAMFRPGRKRSD